jgi:hypothetical protein
MIKFAATVNQRVLASAFISVVSVVSGTIAAAGEIVGRTALSLPSGIQDVLIEDVSPDRGSGAQYSSSHYATPWGLSLAISRSGRQLAASPAAGWITENGPVYVDHVATVDADGRLITFYWSPPDPGQSVNTDVAAWKAVDVSEKTNVRVATEQPTTWRVRLGQLLHERIAARDEQGHIRVFSWSPGKDWSAETVSASAPNFAGPVTSWTSEQGGQTLETVAARTDKGALVLWARSGGGWSMSDVTAATQRSIAGDPQGWLLSNGTERIAAHDASQNLLLFTRVAGQSWSVQDLTAATNGQTAIGPVDAWEQDRTQRIAARSPGGDLLIFAEDPIEGYWSVENVSTATKVKISAGPVHWEASRQAQKVTNIAAPDGNDHIIVFSRQANSVWNTDDVTAATGVGTPHRLAAWTTPSPIQGVIEHLAAPTATKSLHVFSWQPGGAWTAVDVTTRSSGRVIYAATPWAGVFVSRDYGVVWQQSRRPQPGISDATVPGALPVPRTLDVAVSPQDPNLVFAAADREGRDPANARTTSAAGLYRSEDGGKTWALAYAFTCGGQNRPVTQIEFAPDDRKRIYAAGYCGIARSTDGGKNWTLLSPRTRPGTAGLAVYHLAVSARTGRTADARVLVACGPNHIWISRKDGAAGSWIDDTSFSELPTAFCEKTDFQYVGESAAKVLALNPQNPERVYYAHHAWANGPSYYHPAVLGPEAVSCNIPVIFDADDDHFHSNGDVWIRRERQAPPMTSRLADDAKIRFVDLDGDGSWTVGETVYYDSNGNAILDKDEPLIAGQAQPEKTALSDDRRIRYLAGGYGGYDPGFGPRGCGEGSLWLGDFSNATSTNPAATWAQLPGPPVYFVGFSNGSGSTMVRTVPTPKDHLVFFTDSGTLHVAEEERQGLARHGKRPSHTVVDQRLGCDRQQDDRRRAARALYWHDARRRFLKHRQRQDLELRHGGVRRLRCVDRRSLPAQAGSPGGSTLR